ncbi:hypothetical protein TNCV_3118631 [Trichonephila clavipes]|uniref:Uncharacterized protein n=1 Tax=Trichonephila clavipes TaxID=2585209 RepID=A0A8X6W9D1_TRICX|nr:hypothetical protein TNCV_3118631 [Trichonephila clavipes]
MPLAMAENSFLIPSPSSIRSRGNRRTKTLSLIKPHKKKSQDVRYVERSTTLYHHDQFDLSYVVGDVYSDTFSRPYRNEDATNHRRHKVPSVVWWAPC